MIGSVIEKYKITAEIGRGGMGIVYKGFHHALQRDVAIKVLPPQMAQDEISVERFIQEANLIAKLNHENIVQIYDIIEKDGTYYIIMEFLDGWPLDEVIRQNKIVLSMEERVEVIKKACDALLCTHEHGMIHRDVKAANIFITHNKKVKLMDFGISKVTQSTMTTGMAIGTPSYMSPEQAKGNQLDPRTDIYSLGVVLFECLTGRLPFEGADAFAVALKHVHETPPNPLSLDRDIPSNWNKCCLVALEKDRELRFKNCHDMRKAMEGIWPDYLHVKHRGVDRLRDTLGSIFQEKMFLPGMTVVSLLTFILAFEHGVLFQRTNYSPPISRVDERVLTESTLIESEALASKKAGEGSSSISQELPSTNELEGKTEDSLLPLNLIPKEEKDFFTHQMSQTDFDGAKATIVRLSKLYPEDLSIYELEKKLENEIQINHLKGQLDEALKEKEFPIALSTIRKLRALLPKEMGLVGLEQTILSEVGRENEKKLLLESFYDLWEQKRYFDLERELPAFLLNYPGHGGAQSLLERVRQELKKMEKEERLKEGLALLEKSIESRSLSEAFNLLSTLKREFPEAIELRLMSEKLNHIKAQNQYIKSLKKDEKAVATLLSSLSSYLSKKNISEIKEILDSMNEDFYYRETENFKTLFLLAKDIFSTISIMDLKLEEQNANVKVLWKMKAILGKREEVFQLFDNQAKIDLVKRGQDWKVTEIAWVE